MVKMPIDDAINGLEGFPLNSLRFLGKLKLDLKRKPRKDGI